MQAKAKQKEQNESESEELWTPDLVYHKIIVSGTSHGYLVSIPKKWAEDMGLGKGQYVEMRISVMRNRITIQKPSVMDGKRVTGDGGEGKRTNAS